VALAASPARADRGDVALSVEGGYALVAIDTREPSGAALAGSYLRGFTDAVSFRLTGSYSLHAATEAPGKPGGPLHVAGASAGITYAFDYLRIIPFLEVAVGGLYLAARAGSTAACAAPSSSALAPTSSRAAASPGLHRPHDQLPARRQFRASLRLCRPRLVWRWNRF